MALEHADGMTVIDFYEADFTALEAARRNLAVLPSRHKTFLPVTLHQNRLPGFMIQLSAIHRFIRDG